MCFFIHYNVKPQNWTLSVNPLMFVIVAFCWTCLFAKCALVRGICLVVCHNDFKIGEVSRHGTSDRIEWDSNQSMKKNDLSWHCCLPTGVWFCRCPGVPDTNLLWHSGVEAEHHSRHSEDGGDGESSACRGNREQLVDPLMDRMAETLSVCVQSRLIGSKSRVHPN